MGFKFNTLLRAILAGGQSEPSYYLNLTIPGGSPVTIADGQANGTITSTYNAVITASMSPSRTTGVAPLYVNFDMTGTTSTDSTNPTHECFFATDFGDSGAGVFANGVQSAGLTSKNAGYGPVTGHVYETPGTYHPSMTVLDGSGNLVTKTGTIVVQDPDVVYAGTATICISHSNNFTGAPSGATQVNTAGNTDMYAAWNTHKASNKRILFCKADSWTASATLTSSGLSTMIVGGYGTGTAHTFATGSTLVSVTPAFGIGQTIQATGGTDIRFCEFRITANATTNGVGASAGTATQITWFKNEVYGATESFTNDPGSGMNVLYKHEQSCFYECRSDDLYGAAFYDTPNAVTATYNSATDIFSATAHGKSIGDRVMVRANSVQTMPAPMDAVGGMGAAYYVSSTNFTANQFSLATTAGSGVIDITNTGTCTVADPSIHGGSSGYITLTNGAIMGCYFDNDNHGEQVLRIQHINTSHLSNNYFARPNQSKNIIKIHNRSYTNTIGVSDGYAQKIVISGNILDLRGGYSYNGTTVNRVGTSSVITGYGNSGESDAKEFMQHVIFENNITYGCLGNPMAGNMVVEIGCRDFTVRNNIADFSMGDRTTAAAGAYIYTNTCFATVGTSTEQQTKRVYIYNNTMYSNHSGAESMYFTRLLNNSNGAYTDADEITIKNNLWYTPFHGNADKTAYYNEGGACGPTIIATNNTDNGQTSTTSPNFAVHPPVALADWRPNTGSYALDAGATVPVLRDFNNASRYGATYDLGAVLP